MQKLNCTELHNQLTAINSKRTAIEDSWRSLMEKRAKKEIDLLGARELKDEVKQLRRLVEETWQIVGVRKLSAKTKESVEIKFELKERLEYWRKFYASHGVDWVNLPEDLFVSQEQAVDMEALMAEGFDYMLIIPDGLVDNVSELETTTDAAGKTTVTNNQRCGKLHELMSQDYSETWTSGNYDADGKFQGAIDIDKRQGFRIILTKAVQNLEDDELLKTTLNKSLDDLKQPGCLLTQYEGLGEAEYLIFQRAYWEESNKTKHLDKKGWTWLPGSRRPLSGRVPFAYWFEGQLSFFSDVPAHRDVYLGCRLAGSFPI